MIFLIELLKKMSTSNRKILFLGETYRADAITWINGLKEFGNFDAITCELNTSSNTFWKRSLRFLEYIYLIFKIRALVKSENPDIVIAERSTSYGFLASVSGAKIVIIAQQGISDLWPENSWLYFFKKFLQFYAYKKATMLHAWGDVMVPAMKAANVDKSKIFVLPKGIDFKHFKFENVAANNKISAIVTRSLYAEYGHETILQAFKIIKSNNIPFQLTIVGDGNLFVSLQESAIILGIENEVDFLGRIDNVELPKHLSSNNFYISMSVTEGVSASLFEAMACGCYPIVSDILGNQAFINHKINGQLVSVGKAEMLANEIIWAFQHNTFKEKAIVENRNFVFQNANYSVNMTVIAEKYHELITNKLCAE